MNGNLNNPPSSAIKWGWISKTTPYSTTSGTAYKIAFDAVVGSTAFWSASNPTRVLLPWSGIYIVNTRLRFAANATGTRRLAVNDSAASSIAYIAKLAATQALVGTDLDVSILSRAPDYMQDYLEFNVTQWSGGALNLDAGDFYSANIQIAYLGASA